MDSYISETNFKWTVVKEIEFQMDSCVIENSSAALSKITIKWIIKFRLEAISETRSKEDSSVRDKTQFDSFNSNMPSTSCIIEKTHEVSVKGRGTLQLWLAAVANNQRKAFLGILVCYSFLVFRISC